MKQKVVEGELSMNSLNGFAVVGSGGDAEDKWRVKFASKGNVEFLEVPIGTRVRINVEILEMDGGNSE